MDKNYDVIIIGAGLGGLTAGAELAVAGKKVLVIEQHYKVGGSATSFQRNGFTYEAGLHLTTAIEKGHDIYDLFKSGNYAKTVKFIKAPEFYHFIGDDYEYTFSFDMEDNIRRLSDMFPEDKKGIRKYFKTIADIYEQTIEFNSKKGFKRFLAFATSPFRYPKVLRSLFSSVGAFLDRTIKNEKLKAILIANLGYYGDDPYDISALFFAIAQSGYYRQGGCYIRGGSHHLPVAMADHIKGLNGSILLMQQVSKIIMENGKAVGVEFISKRKDASLSKAYAPLIIANTAIPNICHDLLDEHTVKPIVKKYGKYRIGPSIMTIYIALDKPLKELGNNYYSLCFFDKKGYTIKDLAGLCHADFSERPFILCDYSQLDSQLAPEGKGYLVLSMMDYLEDWENLSESDYKFKKKEVARIMTDRVCAYFPDMKDHIEHIEVATARTMKRFLQTPGGTAYGYANSPRQALIFRPGPKSPIDNLYYASAWTLPGAGFGGAIMSGKICAEQIKKDLGME